MTLTSPIIKRNQGDPVIRPAERNDLNNLSRELGQSSFFEDRIKRQEQGRGALLVALLGGSPIGDAYVWWEIADETEIRQHLPGVPLLTHVEVLEEHRSCKVGTKLITAAEQLLSRNGHIQVALAVELDNARAAALYERLGYRDWDHPFIECYGFDDGTGAELPVEKCRVMVKDLPPASA